MNNINLFKFLFLWRSYLSKIMTPLKIPIKENGLKLHQCKYYRYTAIDKF